MVVSSMGDWNDDGYADILLGTATTADRVVLLLGPDGAVAADLGGFEEQEGFGIGLAGLGDVNGDGVEDFLVGAPYSDRDHARGRAYLYSGKTLRNLYVFKGTRPHGAFGNTVARTGDFNSDGLADMYIAFGNYQLNGEQVGAAYVFAGSELYLQGEVDEVAGTASLTIRGGEPGARALVELVDVQQPKRSAAAPPLRMTAVLDQYGEWSSQIPVPPEYQGVRAVFRAYSYRADAAGKTNVIRSGREVVELP